MIEIIILNGVIHNLDLNKVTTLQGITNSSLMFDLGKNRTILFPIPYGASESWSTMYAGFQLRLATMPINGNKL